MSKYFKLAWSGNIFKNEINRFNNEVERELHIKHGNAKSWDSVVGDFNGDGYEDVLVAFYGRNHDGKEYLKPTEGQLVLALGTKSGKFTDGTSLLPNDGRHDQSSTTLETGDFDGDGIDDALIVGSYEDGRQNNTNHGDEFSARQQVLLSNNGDMKLVKLDFTTWGHGADAGDLNGDGRDDFVISGFTADPNGTNAAFFFQTYDGLDQHFVDIQGTLVTTIGDFAVDGKNQVAEYHYLYGQDGPTHMGFRVYDVDDDGTLGEYVDALTPVVRSEEGLNWFGSKTTMTIMKDQNGKEFIDQGLHFADSGDINGDGRDDVVAVRHALSLNYKNGVLNEVGARSRANFECYSMTPDGLEIMTTKIKGWDYPDYAPFDIDLIDWNGDGHLDIFLPLPEIAKGEDHSETGRVFLNDGVGNFTRLDQKFIPKGGDLWTVAEPMDVNNDGIMDFFLRPESFDGSWQKWGKFSESLFLGTKRIFGDGTTHNPAKDGAAGFNEAYYLGQYEEAGRAMRSGGYESALDHYLAAGKQSGAFGFAAGSHIYGYGGSETIVLREGNESVDAFGGDDIITGGAGADTLDGGKGSDTFVYLAVTDSGVTPHTRDIIEDFEAGNDRIDLTGIDAIAGTASNDAFSFPVPDGAAFTGKGGELRWYSTGSGATAAKIIEGDVDGDGVADFQIELAGIGAISVNDLVL